MLPIAAPGDPSTELPLVIDGIVFNIRPSDYEPVPVTVGDRQEMLDGSKTVWERRPGFSGIANKNEHFTISFPFSALSGDNLVNMKMIRAEGGLHRLTLWTPEALVYTLAAGVTRIYLPHFRSCAPHLYSGLELDGGRVIVDTDVLPTLATLDGAALNVTYAEGPTLAAPGGGGLVIARQPDTSGETIGYTAMRLGDTPAGGEKLRIWMFMALLCDMEVTNVNLSGLREDHAYTFVEL